MEVLIEEGALLRRLLSYYHIGPPAQCVDMPAHGEAASPEQCVDTLQGGASILNLPSEPGPARQRLEQLLKDLVDNSPPTPEDNALNDYRDIPALQQALAKLTVKSKDKKIDVFFRSRLTSMVGALNLFLDSEMSYTWHEASLIAAKTSGAGPSRARNIRNWIHHYLHKKLLPFHQFGKVHSSVLENEDFAHLLKLHLLEVAKTGFIRAQDVVDFIATPDIQAKIGHQKTSISVWTAQHWLKKMDW